MEGYEFYKQIREVLPENFVDRREGNMPGAGDLYIKKTAESEELVKHYDFHQVYLLLKVRRSRLVFGTRFTVVGVKSMRLGIRNFKSKASAQKKRCLRRKTSIYWIVCGMRRLPQRDPSV